MIKYPKTRVCPEGKSPFANVEWQDFTAEIKDDKGNIIFKQEGVKAPNTWSQLAVNIVASKYFYGDLHEGTRESNVGGLVDRVSQTIAKAGLDLKYFDTEDSAENFRKDLAYLLINQMAAFNSPVWFNVGVYELGARGNNHTYTYSLEKDEIITADDSYKHPQCSACFIQSVEDTMESIMQLATNEANLFKYGSGTGTDLSKIRSEKEKLSGGGTPSGPLSFMRIYDQIAGVVKSGGKTRRAAKMTSMFIWHPDVMDFINCKLIEEEKAKILMKNGYSYSDAYSSVMFQNANLSIRLPNDFMQAVKEDKEYFGHWVTDPEYKVPMGKAKDVFRKLSEATWKCGDPGVQFDDIINKWHTCPNSGRILASNPCSEYMFIDDSACNLASINLMKYYTPGKTRKDNNFDVNGFVKACEVMVLAMDIIVDMASYPTYKIACNSHKFRPLGLGYANLGALIMSMGYSYDSDAGRGICSGITALMQAAAWSTSHRLAEAMGSFEGYELNAKPMADVIKAQTDTACAEIGSLGNGHVFKDLLGLGQWECRAAKQILEKASELWQKEVYTTNLRNAQVTVLAPTGTIGFMMDCNTTGIEPELALVKYKSLTGGGILKLVNNTVPLALRSLGYDEETIVKIMDYIDKNDMIEGCPDLQEKHLSVFDCAFKPAKGKRFLSWQAHLKMMAAAQPFISGAISKTVNMPNSATIEDIMDAYMMAYDLGLKAVAIYRDGSKGAQVLTTSLDTDTKEEEKKEEEKKEEVTCKKTIPYRHRLPDERNAITHKFNISGHEGYITIGLYPDGSPGELFITMAKEGSTVGGLMNCFGTAVSLGLQYGVPLNAFIKKFAFQLFEPNGFTKNKEIRNAKSIIDYIFRWMELHFEKVNKENKEEKSDKEAKPSVEEAKKLQLKSFQDDAPVCPVCGSIMYRNGSCYLCQNCGGTSGCS